MTFSSWQLSANAFFAINFRDDSEAGGTNHSNLPRYGAGGSESSGGAGGYAWYGDGTATYSIIPSSNGVLGQGGTGDGNSGGDGGGYYAGGGGADAGGGSSYTHPTLCTSVVHEQGVQTGSGKLIITIHKK